MLILYPASVHALVYTIFRRLGLLGLLIGSLGACQRASYQFPPVAGTAYQAIAPAPAIESTVPTVATRPVAWLGKSYRQIRHGVRLAVKLPRPLRQKTLGLPRLRAAVVAASVAAPAHRQLQEPGLIDEPVRHRSRTIAILLAALAITYLPLSLHNFYLGYYGRGALAIALLFVGSSFAVVGLIAGIFSSGGIGVVGVLGLAMLAGWFVWQLSDLIRIITGDLQPKNGSYGKS
jgi:hypothetical protein